MVQSTRCDGNGVIAAVRSNIEASGEQLDLATVIQVSQAASREIVLEKLLDIVMRKAMEHAGAQRSLLIVPQGDELQIEAESMTSGNDAVVRLTEAPVAPTALPESIVRLVMRTHESVRLDDASAINPFSRDPYLLRQRVRSVLCLPLLNQAKLSGVLYLENNLAPRVFTPERVTLLKVLASQAAISLENSRLYRDLRRSEAWLSQAQRLSHTGYWVYDPTTMAYLSWSEESYRIWGFDPREGLPSRDAMWKRIHPDDRDRVWGIVQQAIRQKTDFTTEFRLLLPDATVKYVRGTSHHLFSPDGALVEVVTTTVDLTEQLRAENEREKLRQLQCDLAHLNRLSMMGELSASLAHEVKQPIATARNNARAAHNFLNAQPPDLGEVREAIGCVIGDVDRAGEIIGRIVDQIKKAPLRKEHCDLNAAIHEVIGLTQSMSVGKGILIRMRLAERLPPVQGDRVQLQQVLLNLILNAAEAMDSVETGPREVLISTDEDPAGVLVAVRDSGPGIDPEHLERVFESFFTTKPRGTGMGLSVCRSIIDAHAGRLWAEANEPRGAVFQFTLPGAEGTSCGVTGRESRAKTP